MPIWWLHGPAGRPEAAGVSCPPPQAGVAKDPRHAQVGAAAGLLALGRRRWHPRIRDVRLGCGDDSGLEQGCIEAGWGLCCRRCREPDGDGAERWHTEAGGVPV